MPCWRACGPARWGRRSSYGNGFAIFSRYVTEPRDLPSESSRPTPDIRLSALIRAIVSPWKGNSEPPLSATVIYRKFSSIPLPCPKEQGDAGGRRRAIARLHGAVPLGMRGDPLRTRGTADRRSCRARFAGRAPPCLPPSRGNAAIERQARGACPAKKPNPIINRRFPRRRIRRLLAQRPLRTAASRRARAPSSRGPPPRPRAPAPPTARSGDT